MTADNADDLYTRLLTINTDAMEGRLYEVAFHALTAALHAAEVRGDAERFDAVKRLAERQLEHIDKHEPEHRFSSRSAAERGQHPVFATLARQAHTRALLVRKPHP